MLTLFSIPKPFIGKIECIQKNAIESWVKQIPEAKIILLGDESGVASFCRELGLTHLPNIEMHKFGTPYLHSAFYQAEQIAEGETLGFINTDIVFLSNPAIILKKISSQYQNFLAIGERTDLDVSHPLTYYGKSWESKLHQEAQEKGVRHGEMGIDYFFYQKGLFRNMPPFLVGRPGYDHWMIGHALFNSAKVIDVSADFEVIHQNHERSYASLGRSKIDSQPYYQQGIEAEHNRSYLEQENFLPENIYSAQYLLKNGIFITPSGTRLLRRKWKHFTTKYPFLHYFERLMRLPLLRNISFIFPFLPSFSAAIPEDAFQHLCARFGVSLEQLVAWPGIMRGSIPFFRSYRFRYRERHTAFRKLPNHLKRAIYIYEEATLLTNRIKWRFPFWRKND